VARSHAMQSPHWRTHRHDFFEVFHLESGCARHLLEKANVPIEAGQLAFLRPEHAHGLKSERGEFRLTNFAIRADIVGTFLDRHPAVGIWRSESPEHLMLTGNQLGAMRSLAAGVAAGGRSAVDAEFLLAALARLMGDGMPVGQRADLPGWLSEAMVQAEDPEVLRIGVPALVRLCARSPEHVSRSFRGHLGLTPTEWMNQARITLACRLLETSAATVLEIALECGFQNPSHFHRLFRKATGASPLAYRRRGAGVIGG
jgi:AraC family cel operon transcriptional repressor